MKEILIMMQQEFSSAAWLNFHADLTNLMLKHDALAGVSQDFKQTRLVQLDMLQELFTALNVKESLLIQIAAEIPNCHLTNHSL